MATSLKQNKYKTLVSKCTVGNYESEMLFSVNLKKITSRITDTLLEMELSPIFQGKIVILKSCKIKRYSNPYF